ncbi:hydrolase or acyltransferase (alpha/beta hydrolase superfamily)-like protein [Ketogulonicigenium robustum]|uniref:Hydrolase or acyltransferase (Alpha/beta hydrolase superfamily)-like protein n=1 Tax=Ketogulonicigenium robustum TaxID=92947 RepID=A0A1W6NXG9_9RHOB|nr:alpha/beta hydrolase [Ketogulonicigenium robustum]ARO13932.1 hydrolase or acyltransferase (alpha/beta hydrolase superfamily)-like protein [Ketogulonicigenium robustum]
MIERFITPEGRDIAFEHLRGQGPTVMFCGGYRSDMEGNKALALREWAQARGLGFMRFDYSGHGISGGEFTDGCIGDWAADARAVLARIDGPVVLVGSSMGGWISLLLARAFPERLAGLVTIAAAPDFTEDLVWASLNDAQKQEMQTHGRILQPSEYGAPYPYTLKLVEDGRSNLVLRTPLHLPFPVRLLQGTADVDVPPQVAYRLLDHVTGEDIRLTLVKGADHRFSTPACLRIIETAVAEVAAL